MTTYLKQYARQFRPNIALAAPVMFGQAANVFVGLVDNYMVARLGGDEGQTALAAGAAANAVFILILLLGTGISCGMTPLISYSYAEKDDKGIRNILRNGFAMNLAVGIVLTALVYFTAPILQHPALGQTEAVGRLAVPYLRIVGFSLIPLMIFQTYKQLSDGMSDTWPGMLALILSNLVNIVGNYVFIYGHWGAPRLGLKAPPGGRSGPDLSGVFRSGCFVRSENLSSLRMDRPVEKAPPANLAQDPVYRHPHRASNAL